MEANPLYDENIGRMFSIQRESIRGGGKGPVRAILLSALFSELGLSGRGCTTNIILECFGASGLLFKG